MEALSFPDLRRPITSENLNDSDGGKEPEEEEEEEGEDSFFELELAVPDFKADSKPNGPALVSPSAVGRKPSPDNAQIDHKFNFSLSKRKILPIEFRPQSPISLLKSAPKFRVFMMFRRSKSLPADEAEKTEVRNRGRKFFTLRFQLKEMDQPALKRDSSLRKNGTAASCSDSPLLGESNSKRFSKEAIHKYLRLVKPPYVKVSKRQTGGVAGVGFAGQFSPTASVAATTPSRELPAKSPAGFRVVACRHLGKSKSASASASASVTGIMSPARRDDSLLQQHDGIESAILHCKRSFSSSRDLSPLSPSTSARSSSDGNSIS